MNSASTSVLVTVRNDLDKQSYSELTIIPLSMGKRLTIAFKSLAICWSAALLCAFIPVFHFVLVPLGFMIGLFLFLRKLHFHELLQSGKINCPGCLHSYEPKPQGFNWPKQENCPSCRSDLILKKKV